MEKNVVNRRLERLLKSTIFNYYDSVDPDNDMDLYDKMFEHLLNGDFDDIFIAPKLEGKSFERKQKAFDLARKYAYLCFFDGNPSYWPDSIEGVGILDLPTLSKRVLDNYNFLLEVADEGGKESLDELAVFQKSKIASESAVVDYLRNTFGNDEALKACLAETSKDDSIYKNLTTAQKTILYDYPQGVLYRYDDDKITINSEEYLISKIAEKSYYEDIATYGNFNKIVNALDDYEYESIIRDIYFDYIDSKKKAGKYK